MKNPLNKRVFRELKNDLGKYIALFLFLTLTIGFVSGFLVAGSSMTDAYNKSFEKYNIEDGHFTLAVELPKEVKEKLEKEDVTIYPLNYKDFDLSDSNTIRVYKERKDVNKICLMDGEMPSKDDEIVLDRLYAHNNALSIGDTITLDKKIFRISGTVAFSDYSALFKNNTDMMFNASTFSIACVTDHAYNALSDNGLSYTYAWKNNDPSLNDKESSEKGDDLKDILGKTGLVTDFVKQDNNQAIKFTGNDIGSDSVMVITLLYIIMVVLAFIFAVTTRSMMEKEAGTIGALRASGYTKGEMISHYIRIPILMTLLAAIIGNIFGYTIFKNMVAGIYYHSYSLPTYVTLWNSKAFLMTTVIPCLIVAVVVTMVIMRIMQFAPLQFLRRELSANKKKKVMNLKHFRFFTRFRLRVIAQNMSSYVTLFVGVFMASFLLFFGMMLPPMLDGFRAEVENSEISQYQYVLKAPVETADDDAEKYAVISLLNDNDEEVTVYGIQESSAYLKAKLPRGIVLASDGYMEKYGVKKADKISLEKKYEEESYDFKINGSYHYPATMALFMNIDDFRETFDKDENYFTGYFNDKKLTDIDDKMIATIITESDLTLVADQLNDSMGESFMLLMFFAMALYFVVMYILSKQIIEKNSKSISMIKILGFSNGEVSRLYNLTTGIVMIVSLLISLPICYYLMKVVFYIMMRNFNGWLTYYIAPEIYPEMVIAGILCYAVVYLVQTRKIRKIPMADALKNME